MAENRKRSPLFAESPMGIMVVDREGAVLDVNASGCQGFARPRSRLMEKLFLDWILPGDRSRTSEAVDRILAGEAIGWKARIRRGDGRARLQEFQGTPLRRSDQVEGALLFFRDVPKGFEGRPETRQLQELLENLPGQFLLVTDKKGRIRYSSGLSRTHFLDGASLLGKEWKSLLGKEREGEGTVASLLKTVGGGESWAGLQWHRRQDGVSFPAEVFSVPYLDPKTGQVLGILAVGRDLSKIREWREKAEGVQPLAQIGSLTTRITQEMTRGLSRLEETLSRNGGGPAPILGNQDIRTELGRLRTFLDGISEFGDRGGVRREAVSLPDLVHDVLEDAAGRMGSMGIQPTVEVPPNLPPAYADPRYLARILQLLMSNALEALQGSNTPLLRLELKNGPDGVILRITNSSARVEVDRLGEIFDPFFTTKDGHPGLGLAVAKGMIRAQDGRIWGEIPEDGFLTIALELPREDPERVRAFKPRPLNLARSRNILVVDDDESVRGALRTFLEKVGFEVKEAWSGRSALAALTSGRLPDVVLTDLKMNDGSGYWFLEELSRDFPRLVGKTVIITGDADHEAATDLAEGTGCPLVRKPFELPELLEILDELCLKG